MTLAEMLRQRRRAQLLTQEEAAEAAGIPVRSWQRYEIGTGIPSACNARALADWLGIETTELEAILTSEAEQPADGES